MRTLVVLAGAVLMAAGCAGPHVSQARPSPARTGSPSVVARIADPHVRNGLPELFVKHGRYTQTVTFDHGALVVGVASRPPMGVTMRQALVDFQATTPAYTVTYGLTVGYGSVALAPGVMVGSPRGRTLASAWVFTSPGQGPFDCPYGLQSRADVPDPDSVVIVSEGGVVSYTGIGAFCGPSRPATASYAGQYVSIPWVLVKITSNQAVIRYTALACETQNTVATKAGPSGRLVTTVEANMLSQPGACQPRQMQTNTAEIELNPDDLPPLHGPLGPVPGVVTNLTNYTLTYSTNS